MRLISTGAEAMIYASEHMQRKALVKHRMEKKYRNVALDENLRVARTRQECVLLHKAKLAGVRTPVIYEVDRKSAKIIMELIAGEKLRELLKKASAERGAGICEMVGAEIAKLHSAGIIHGDLTTSNMLLCNNRITFVDFGLGFESCKVEDRAVDLLVFKKTFNATHFAIANGWERIIKGYLREMPSGRVAVERLAEVEARARYMDRH